MIYSIEFTFFVQVFFSKAKIFLGVLEDQNFNITAPRKKSAIYAEIYYTFTYFSPSY